jgi:hypothetical protein
MLVAEGTTAIVNRLGGATTRVEIADNVPTVAVITVVPCSTPVADPLALMSETLWGTENQLAMVVKFCVLPSEYVPVSWYCWVKPTATVAEDGVSEIATKAGAPTVTTVDALWAPELAWTMLVHRITPVTKPVLLTVA